MSALCMALKRAKRLGLLKLMVFSNLTCVEKNLLKLPKWVEKNWRHGDKAGKGKQIANVEEWKKIHAFLEEVEVDFIWNPKSPTFQDLCNQATSMALLHTVK